MALEIVRRFVNGAWKTEAAEGGGGGSLPPVSIVTYTIEGPTWIHEELYDLGTAGLFSYKAESLVLTPDGEVFGTADGELGVDASAQVSLDGVTWASAPFAPPTPADAEDLDANFYISQVGQFFGGNVFAWRYFKLAQSMRVESTDTVYAGANSPSAEIRATFAPLELWG